MDTKDIRAGEQLCSIHKSGVPAVLQESFVRYVLVLFAGFLYSVDPGRGQSMVDCVCICMRPVFNADGIGSIECRVSGYF